jgi:hypothetical protein
LEFFGGGLKEGIGKGINLCGVVVEGGRAGRIWGNMGWKSLEGEFMRDRLESNECLVKNTSM